MNKYFIYGKKELRILKEQDPVLAQVIDTLGPIKRKVDADVFSSVIYHMISQQISTKARETIWMRLKETIGSIEPATICSLDVKSLQALGMTYRKAENILLFAQKVQAEAFDLSALEKASDEEAMELLCSLKGIGPWTAEMVLLFGLQRPDICSYGDLAIRRGMCRVYDLESIDKKQFEVYRKNYHPYGIVASLYLWAIGK